MRPDYSGVYTIRGLPPGTYVVTVVSDPAVLSDPAKLSALAATGTRVTLAEGETERCRICGDKNDLRGHFRPLTRK